MDSWFTCEIFIDAVLNVKHQVTHLIGMYKTPKTKFEYMGGSFTYSQIRNLLGRAKRCRKLGLYYNETIVGFRGKQIKLFFSKQGKNGKWKVFITTNVSLSFIKMIETVFIEIDEEQLLERIINDEKAYEKLAIILEPDNKKIAS